MSTIRCQDSVPCILSTDVLWISDHYSLFCMFFCFFFAMEEDRSVLHGRVIRAEDLTDTISGAASLLSLVQESIPLLALWIVSGGGVRARGSRDALYKWFTGWCLHRGSYPYILTQINHRLLRSQVTCTSRAPRRPRAARRAK